MNSWLGLEVEDSVYIGMKNLEKSVKQFKEEEPIEQILFDKIKVCSSFKSYETFNNKKRNLINDNFFQELDFFQLNSM